MMKSIPNDHETSAKFDGMKSHFDQRYSRALFSKTGKTMNGRKYLKLIKNKLQLHMSVHDCKIFMQDRAPCHRSELLTDFFGG